MVRKKAFSVPEFCESMGISRRTVYSEIAKGRVRTFKIGARRLVSEQACDDYIRLREAEALEGK